MNIYKLGFSQGSYENKDFNVGRIISVQRESYVISDGERDFFAKVTGNLMFSANSPLDFPTVGDFVLFQNFENDSAAIIHKILNRKNLLKRKTPGKKIDYQLIAANVDTALIMQALDNDFNVNRLERYLSMVNEFEIEPIILLSKSDLVTKEELDEILRIVKSKNHNVDIYSFSNFEKSVEIIKNLFEPQKSYCLIGSSGVGKTTLLNIIIKENKFNTQEVRLSDSKGKHTTTSRQLVLLENGAMVIDTPGMRELGNISINEGIEKTFDEISVLSKNCKFSDCTHTVENGCAILEALDNGEIDEQRYSNFLKLKKESEYNERSYFEKRKKDKEFGKMVKSVIKHDKRK